MMTEGIFLEDRFRYDCSGNWYKGSVHVHTTNGSGRLSLPETAAFYADGGYDFICVTDKRVPIDKKKLDGELPLPNPISGFPMKILMFVWKSKMKTGKSHGAIPCYILWFGSQN
jgi:hypothetical protein